MAGFGEWTVRNSGLYSYAEAYTDSYTTAQLEGYDGPASRGTSVLLKTCPSRRDSGQAETGPPANPYTARAKGSEMCRSSGEVGGPRRCSGDTRAAYQHAAATVTALEAACRPGIAADSVRVGLRVAERINPNRTGRVIEVRDIAINPGGPEFRFALVELDGLQAFGQPVRHLYLLDALRNRPTG